VASIGHGLGGIWTFTTGMVSNIYPDRGERPVFQTQIPLNPGNSGGPVLDRRGRVVGVVTAGIRDSNSINFAIRSDVAVRKLAKLQASCECLVILAPPDVPVFVDGELAGKRPRVAVPADARAYEVFAVVAGQMRKRIATFPKGREVDLTR
jgi:S1-C subfamily serine protease